MEATAVDRSHFPFASIITGDPGPTALRTDASRERSYRMPTFILNPKNPAA